MWLKLKPMVHFHKSSYILLLMACEGYKGNTDCRTTLPKIISTLMRSSLNQATYVGPLPQDGSLHITDKCINSYRSSLQCIKCCWIQYISTFLQDYILPLFLLAEMFQAALFPIQGQVFFQKYLQNLAWRMKRGENMVLGFFLPVLSQRGLTN